MKTGNMAIHLTQDGHLFDVSEGITADTALELMAEMSSALVRSVNWNMKQEKKNDK